MEPRRTIGSSSSRASSRSSSLASSPTMPQGRPVQERSSEDVSRETDAAPTTGSPVAPGPKLAAAVPHQPVPGVPISRQNSSGMMPAASSSSLDTTTGSPTNGGVDEDSFVVGEFREKQCPICFERYTESNPAVVYPCNHTFHYQCAESWRMFNESCPVCLRHTEEGTARIMTPRDIRRTRTPRRHRPKVLHDSDVSDDDGAPLLSSSAGGEQRAESTSQESGAGTAAAPNSSSHGEPINFSVTAGRRRAGPAAIAKAVARTTKDATLGLFRKMGSLCAGGHSEAI